MIVGEEKEDEDAATGAEWVDVTDGRRARGRASSVVYAVRAYDNVGEGERR